MLAHRRPPYPFSGLWPIGMPETVRKLAASALAPSVRSAAAWALGPVPLEVGLSNACERILHKWEAHLAHLPDHAVVQLDFRNAFTLVSRAAVMARPGRALPELAQYLQWVYGGEMLRVCGWAEDNGGEPALPRAQRRALAGGRASAWAAAALPLPLCQWLAAQWGAQQGDPLGPPLHAAAMALVLDHLQATHPGLLISAFHDDVVAARPPAQLAALLRAAAEEGAKIDAELVPAKCVGWSTAGAPAPAG